MGNDIRSVAFPEAGEGVVFLLRNKDLATLQQRLGDEYMKEATDRFDKWDMTWINAFISVGLKKDGKRLEEKELAKAMEALEDTEGRELRDRLLDGIQLKMTGETWKEFVDRIFKETQEAQAKLHQEKKLDTLDNSAGEVPSQQSPGTSSSTSAAPPSGQE